ncbi:MAG: HugZ family protein [Rhodomicrobiaceae bacterium]
MSVHSGSESGVIEASARSLIRGARIGSLATLDAATAAPYASLIACATGTDGSPLFLISTLAWHTRNLEADPRASVLFAAEAGEHDPLTLGRVSLMGVANRIDDALARQRYLARHPGAAVYADFTDFAFWRLAVERAHHVGGFGRISTLSADALLLDAAMAANWSSRIEAVIGEINVAEPELLARIGASLSGKQAEGWQIAACDPDGCDLIAGDVTARLAFPQCLDAPEALAGVIRELGAP